MASEGFGNGMGWHLTGEYQNTFGVTKYGETSCTMGEAAALFRGGQVMEGGLKGEEKPRASGASVGPVVAKHDFIDMEKLNDLSGISVY